MRDTAQERCFKHLEAGYIMSDFKLGRKPFQFKSSDIFKIFNQKFKKILIWLLSECKVFLIIFLHIMTGLYI